MTIDEIDKEIEFATKTKEISSQCAHEEQDREYRADHYARIDRINDRLSELYRMKRILQTEQEKCKS